MLHLPVELGGLNLTDYDRRFRSLRLAWITRFYNSPKEKKWKIFFNLFLNKVRELGLGINIFKAYIPMRRDLLTQIPTFYKTLYQDWGTFTNHKRPMPQKLELIYYEPLLHNLFMPDHTKPFEPIRAPNWYQSCNKAQFKTIWDICATPYRKGYHTSPELQELLNHRNIQKIINVIIRSLPTQWNNLIRNSDPPKTHKDDTLINVTNEKGKKQEVLMSTLNTKTIYTFLADKSIDSLYHDAYTNNTTHYRSWERILGKINWKSTFTSMYKNHIDRKSTDIQFKTIHANIQTKYIFFVSGYRNNPFCDRCYTVIEEYIEHIFLDCAKSKQTWTKIVALAKKLFQSPTIINDPKWIITGYSCAPVPYNFKQTLKDFRLAFFKTAWKARYDAMWNNIKHNELALFTKSVEDFFTLRCKLAVKQNNLNEFKINYGVNIICKISKNKIELT